MLLFYSNIGDTAVITRISGNDSVKKHLTDLGFIAGEKVSVISKVGCGNLIVKIKESRVAIDKAMASKIFI